MKTLKYCIVVLLIAVFSFFGSFNLVKSISLNNIIDEYSCKPFIRTNYKEIISNNDSIKITHKLMNERDDYYVSYDINNVNILHVSKDKSGASTLLIESYAEKAYINILYTNNLIENDIYSRKIYIYCNDEHYFLSDISFEQCVANNKKNNDQFHGILQYGISACDMIEYNGLRTNDITVTGFVQWTDSASNLHFGRDVKVEVWDTDGNVDDTLLASGYTNDEGQYSFTFSNDKSSPENGYDIRVKFFSNNSYVNVVSPSDEVTYCIAHPTITTDVDNDTVVTKSIIIDNNTADKRSFQVLQAMTMAAKYAKEMNGTALSNIKVVFPDISNGTCYLSTENRIYIIGDDYCDWDVMQHEYGHYTRDFLTTTSVSGGIHYLNVNLIDDYLAENSAYETLKNDKINLAWSEGWATYFAIASQLDCNASALNIPNVGNEKYEDTIDASIVYNLETGEREYTKYSVFYSLGEANEAAIMSILYDFLDGTTESFDYIQYTHQHIWNNTMNNSVTNLSEFISQYNSESNSNKIKIGRILSKYGVSSNTLTNPNIVSTEVPTFIWTAGGGSTNMPNNRFRIVFYSPNYVQLVEKSNLTITSCTLTESEWTTLLSYSYVYWVVYAEQTDTPLTGEYISEPCTLNMPSVTSLALSTIVSETLSTGGYYWYKFTSYDSGTYTFETTGSTDTYGELFSSLVAGHSIAGRLAYDDDSGSNHNFKINYNLNYGQTVYIRIRGYNWTSTGQFSFEINLQSHIHNYTYSYSWLNYNQHKSFCDCGMWVNELHVVSAKSLGDGLQYVTCILCGGPANAGIVPGFKGIQITESGSFISPNGTLVLTDEDMCANIERKFVVKTYNHVTINNEIIPYLNKKRRIIG